MKIPKTFTFENKRLFFSWFYVGVLFGLDEIFLIFLKIIVSIINKIKTLIIFDVNVLWGISKILLVYLINANTFYEMFTKSMFWIFESRDVDMLFIVFKLQNSFLRVTMDTVIALKKGYFANKSASIFAFVQLSYFFNTSNYLMNEILLQIYYLIIIIFSKQTSI